MSIERIAANATSLANRLAGDVKVSKRTHRFLAIALAAVVTGSAFVSTNQDVLGVGQQGVTIDLAVATFIASVGRIFVPAD